MSIKKITCDKISSAMKENSKYKRYDAETEPSGIPSGKFF